MNMFFEAKEHSGWRLTVAWKLGIINDIIFLILITLIIIITIIIIIITANNKRIAPFYWDTDRPRDTHTVLDCTPNSNSFPAFPRSSNNFTTLVAILTSRMVTNCGASYGSCLIRKMKHSPSLCSSIL